MIENTDFHSKYTVRMARASDAFEIAKVHFDVFQDSFRHFVSQSFLDTLSLSKMVQFKERMLAKQEGIHLVSMYQEKVIGFCDAGHLHMEGKNRFPYEGEWEKYKNCGELYSIYISKDHQRSGVGQVLFKQAHLYLIERGFTSFIVWSLKDNLSASNFYEKLGGELVVTNGIIKFAEKNYVGLAYLF
jgi:ribosomal protein S18 acetylase RimI-like enzyme